MWKKIKFAVDIIALTLGATIFFWGLFTLWRIDAVSAPDYCKKHPSECITWDEYQKMKQPKESRE